MKTFLAIIFIVFMMGLFFVNLLIYNTVNRIEVRQLGKQPVKVDSLLRYR